MTQGPGQSFVALNEVERRSKLRLLAHAKGQLLLWQKGSKERHGFRVKDFERERDVLIVHREPQSPGQGQEVLGHFDLNGVPFLFKARVIKADVDEIHLECKADFFKSERRISNRLLTSAGHQVMAHFSIPAHYEEGKVLDIQRRPGQTGLFKSFLKLVEGQAQREGTEDKLKLRPQDISPTGMSVFIGPAELDWFKTGEDLAETELHFPDEVMRLPKVRIVYVVDHIGPDQRVQKRYKVGLRFDEMPASLEAGLKARVEKLMKQFDVNQEFEEFVR